MRVTDKYVFFWKGWLSNFWRAPFMITWNEPPMKGWKMISRQFFCTEQYFMFMKACAFNDKEIGEKILKSSSPQEARKLGQQVRGYSDEVWGPLREQVMFEANVAKYTQNEELKEKLLNPEWEGKYFVEASPFDKIWAIGLEENDDRVLDPTQWRGTNLLGQCLDKVREKLKE